MTNKITITVSGPAGSGRSFIRHQIAAMLSGRFGLPVQIEERELTGQEVTKRLYDPEPFAQAIKSKGTAVIVADEQIDRSSVLRGRSG